MAGQKLERDRRNAAHFAELILERSHSVSGIRRNIAFGDLAINLGVSRADALGDLICGAFFASNVRIPFLQLSVARQFDVKVLPRIDWAAEWFTTGREIPQAIAYPYRIFADRVTGIVYVLDTVQRRAAVWIRHDCEIDLRSFITPFRIMLAWAGSLIGGEVVHASAAVVDGRGFAFSGAPGAGKSTLSISLGRQGHSFISDDSILLYGDKMYALYSRAKLDHSSQQLLGIANQDITRLEGAPLAKGILDVNQVAGFQRHARLDAWCFPTLGSKSGYFPIDDRRAYRYLIEYSLPEILGGSTSNRLRLAKLVHLTPAFRVLTTSDLTSNGLIVGRLANELMKVTKDDNGL